MNESEQSIPVIYRLKYTNLIGMLSPYMTNEHTINIFIDTRSVVPHIYNKDTARLLVENKDKWLFAKAIFSLISHYTAFFAKFAFPAPRFILFSESGQSMYHSKLSKKYKSKRNIAKINTYGKDLKYEVSEVMYEQITTLYQHLNNKYDNMACYNLDYLEADFIPYYIIKKYGLDDGSKYRNIILSKDKDLAQCLIYNNTFQMVKRKGYSLLTKKTAYRILDKMNSCDTFEPEQIITNGGYLVPILLAMEGDAVDGVEGLKRVGFKTAFRYIMGLHQQGFIDLTSLGTYLEPDDLLDAIEENSLKDTISRNIIASIGSFNKDFSLVSFDRLINDMAVTNKDIEKFSCITIDTKEIEKVLYR